MNGHNSSNNNAEMTVIENNDFDNVGVPANVADTFS